MIRSGLPNLLLQLIAEVTIFPYVAEIAEERAGGDEETGEENPAAAFVGEFAHLAEADGNDEGRQCG